MTLYNDAHRKWTKPTTPKLTNFCAKTMTSKLPVAPSKTNTVTTTTTSSCGSTCTPSGIGPRLRGYFEGFRWFNGIVTANSRNNSNVKWSDGTTGTFSESSVSMLAQQYTSWEKGNIDPTMVSPAKKTKPPIQKTFVTDLLGSSSSESDDKEEDVTIVLKYRIKFLEGELKKSKKEIKRLKRGVLSERTTLKEVIDMVQKSTR
ncbi:hypothetical protein TL16_g12524 [Triparma laevis f. inornata]|uniref:Uncharacterized protein n=1 Tax=Triparma laevis f. inornata TaxID=1714386 RepID=A0A9W7BMD5_9STRA|nr:hypothetical protein TL16_g12524 [Triparma laevis f. inornata]